MRRHHRQQPRAPLTPPCAECGSSPGRLGGRSRLETEQGGGAWSRSQPERRVSAYIHPLRIFGDLTAFDLEAVVSCRR